MAAKKWNIGSLFVKSEATFNTDPDPDGSDYLHVKAAPGATFQPVQNIVEREGFIETMNRIPHVMGGMGGTLQFQLELKGSGTPATGLANAAESDELLAAFLGGKFAGTGTTVNDVSPSTTAFDVTSAVGLRKGMMVLVNCGAPYGFVPRFITNIVATEITLNRALPAAPANAAVVHASTMYYRTDANQKSMSFASRRDGIVYNFHGCKLDAAAISGVETQGIAMLDLTFSCTSWEQTVKADLPSTVLAGNRLTPPPVIKGACFSIGGTEELMYSLGFDFGITTVFQDSTCAQGPENPNSINAGFVNTNARPTGSVKPYYAAAHMTDYVAGTERELAFAAGAGLGNAWGLWMPKSQFTAVTAEDRNGMVGENVTFALNDNGADPVYVLNLA